MRDERRRAPADLLAILTLLLLAAAGLMLALGIVFGDGMPRNLALNLTSEILGAALTVGIIGGVWQGLQASSEGALEDLIARTADRRQGMLSEPERTAFTAILELHRRTTTSPSPFPIRLVFGIVYGILTVGGSRRSRICCGRPEAGASRKVQARGSAGR